MGRRATARYKVKRNKVKLKKVNHSRKQRGGQEVRLGILGIFKNEAMVIREWLEHYKWQGADCIVLLDNNSTDNWKDQIKGFEDILTVIPAPKNHSQAQNYSELGLPVIKAKGANVMGIFDIDEYVFGTDGRNLKQHCVEIFGKPDRPSKVTLRWNMFGSSDLKEQPESVRESFTWRAEGEDKNMQNVKSIYWIEDLAAGPINQHTAIVSGKGLESPPGLQLNHYQIMSEEYFKAVKMTRKNVNSPSSNLVRDMSYFKDADAHDREDTQLRDLVRKATPS